MATLKELSQQRQSAMTCGHRMCAGCIAPIIVKIITLSSPSPVVVGCATGCLEVATTIFPYTAWKSSFIHNAFENAAATVSGVETAYQVLRKKGKIKEDIKFIAIGGDGGTYDIGLQSLSGAMERGHDMLYVCLPPETELILEDGSIVKIGQFVDEVIKQEVQKKQIVVSPLYKLGSQFSSIDDKNAELVSLPIQKSLLSWNGREFLPMEAMGVQRKNSPETLIKITTSSGSTLRLTEEHPVLIDGENGSEWKEAALLNVGDEVYAARKIHIFNKDKFYLLDLISENQNISVALPSGIKCQINKELCNEFGSIKKAAEHLQFKYWQFKERPRTVSLYDLRRIYRQIPKLNWERLRNNINEFVVKGGNVIKVHHNQLSEEILYLLGLISSDGYIRERNYGITFINKEIALIKAFEDAYLKVGKGRIVNKVKDKRGIWYLTVGDPILYTLAKRFGIKDDPKELMKLSEPLVAAFLKGYFDGDGHCSILRSRYSEAAIVILSTTKKLLANRIRLLLQRLGIAGFQQDREDRFDITISSAEDVKKFINLVGSNHPMKKIAMEKVKLFLQNRISRGRYFSLAPKVCGKLIKEICEKHNISITSIDKKRNICTLAVSKQRATKKKIREYLDKIESLISNEPLMYKIKNFLVDDFYLDPIKKIEHVEATSKYVYDLTVKSVHLFVPEGKFVISNCYNNEAYMNTGIQRSGATPRGAATTTCPVGDVIPGKLQYRKDLTAIMVAHNIPYVAQASPSHWQDLIKKSEKAFSIKGPKFMNVFEPCTVGWGFLPDQGIELAKLAVETCFWPLYEVENGKYKITYVPKEKKPVVEFFKTQRRFTHLFKSENKGIIDEIQARIDKTWSELLKKSEK